MSDFIKIEIRQLAEVIHEQSEKLLRYEGEAPQIEVDITKENIRRLYEHLDTLTKPVIKKVAVPEIEIPQAIEESIDNQVEDLLQFAEKQFVERANLQSDQQIQVKEEIEENKTVVEVEEKKEHIIEEKEVVKNPMIAPVPISSSEEPSSLGDHLQKKPISSLKAAIGINDKFQFINELFEGSMKLYNSAIEQIERSNNLEAALAIFNNIGLEGKWDEENPAYQQLLDYVERRFI